MCCDFVEPFSLVGNWGHSKKGMALHHPLQQVLQGAHTERVLLEGPPGQISRWKWLILWSLQSVPSLFGNAKLVSSRLGTIQTASGRRWIHVSGEIRHHHCAIDMTHEKNMFCAFYGPWSTFPQEMLKYISQRVNSMLGHATTLSESQAIV